MDERRAASPAALLFCSAMLIPLFALIVILLFHVPAKAESGGPHVPLGSQPDTPPSEGATPVLPEPCRNCAGVQYFRPSARPSDATRQGPVPAESGAPSNAPSTSGAPASPGRTHLSSDPRVNTARVLVERNRFAEALAILRPLVVSEHPDQTDVRFLLGLAASRGSQTRGLTDEQRTALLDEAIAAFRSILIKRPDLVRVRLELGLAFYLTEDDQLAREHFERALVGQPPEALVENVTRFLNIMRARRRWTGYFGFSLAPDTNINAASDAEIIYINGLPFRRGAGQRASSGIGVVGWGGYEYQFPLAERWRLRAGLDLNHREYPGGQFDQTFVAGQVGPRWLITRDTEMSLLATASQRWWGGSSLNYDYGARLEVLHRVYAGFRLSGRAQWVDRKFQQQKFLEGPLMVFSLGASYVLFPTVQVNALVGYQQQDAVANRWDSAGYWTRVGTNVALPWGFTVGLSAEFRWTEFEPGWFPSVTDNSVPRRDQTRILGATLLNRAVTVFGFSPQIAYSNQVRESNAQLFDFKRNLVEMRWVRQF